MFAIKPNLQTLFMKNIYILRTLPLILVATFILSFQAPNEKTVDIPLKKYEQKVTVDPSIGDNDFLIYRTFNEIPMYSLHLFKKTNDGLKEHVVYFNTPKAYEKATYTWINETTAAIKLFNSSSPLQAKFKVEFVGDKARIIQ